MGKLSTIPSKPKCKELILSNIAVTNKVALLESISLLLNLYEVAQ